MTKTSFSHGSGSGSYSRLLPEFSKCRSACAYNFAGFWCPQDKVPAPTENTSWSAPSFLSKIATFQSTAYSPWFCYIEHFVILISTCMCMLTCFRSVWLCETPWTIVYQAPLFMGFSKQEYWSGLPCPTQGIFSIQGSKLCLLCLLHWQTCPLPTVPLGKPRISTHYTFNSLPLQC